MTPEAQTLDAVINALILAVISGLGVIVVPAVYKRIAAYLDNASAREKAAIENEAKRKNDEADEDKTEEKLDQETRQLTNRLAMKAFDREEQLARLKAEYEAQSELLRLTREELKTCRDVQVTEYQRHEAALLEEISVRENTIAKLRNDVAILEATK